MCKYNYILLLVSTIEVHRCLIWQRVLLLDVSFRNFFLRMSFGPLYFYRIAMYIAVVQNSTVRKLLILQGTIPMSNNLKHVKPTDYTSRINYLKAIKNYKLILLFFIFCRIMLWALFLRTIFIIMVIQDMQWILYQNIFVVFLMYPYYI